MSKLTRPLLLLLLLSKSLLGPELCNVLLDQDVEFFLQLWAVSKEEQDLIDDKVRGQNESYNVGREKIKVHRSLAHQLHLEPIFSPP